MKPRRKWRPAEAGKYIASGKHRDVYQHARNEALVVKVVHDLTRIACQQREYEIWRQVIGTRLERYLCPIMWISADGEVIHQMRAKPCTGELPLQWWMPPDAKRGNWGVVRNCPVLLDYTYECVLEGVRKELGIC